MRFLRPLRWPATLLLALGLALHLTVADATGGVLRAVFYALPWPVLAAGWSAVAFMWGWRKACGRICLVLALVCGGWWFAVSHRTHEPRRVGAPTLNVLCWNMAHKKLPSADLQMLLETFKPDIAGLVEVGSRHSDSAPLVATLPAGYTARKLDHAMYLVARGSIRVLDEVELGGVSKFASLEADVDGVTWRVFIVDGASNPLASRADVLSRVLAESQGKLRTLVMGDFNTPAESALFKPWRARFHHAFDEAGDGFRETWPRWMPVLTIDHVWSSQDAPPLRAAKRWLPSSDHAALLVEVSQR